MKLSRRTISVGLLIVACLISLSVTHGIDIVLDPCDRINASFAVSPTLDSIGRADGGGFLIARKSGIYHDNEPGLIPLLQTLPQHVNIDAIHGRLQNATWLFSLSSHAVVGGQLLQHNKMYETDGVNVWGYAPYNNACSNKFSTLDAFSTWGIADLQFLISVSQLQIVPGYGIAHPGDIIYCDINGVTRRWTPTASVGVDNIDGLCIDSVTSTPIFSAGLDMISIPPFILQDPRAYNIEDFSQEYDGSLSMLQRVNALHCVSGTDDHLSRECVFEVE